MRILTKSLMGVFVAASVVGTAPAYSVEKLPLAVRREE